MNVQQFLTGERIALERAKLMADPEARLAELERRVEELTHLIVSRAPPPNVVYYSRQFSPWPFGPMAVTVGDNTRGMAWANP
jgi:hypothetical protein